MNADHIIDRAERAADAVGLTGADKWAHVAGRLGGELRKLAEKLMALSPPEPDLGQWCVEVEHGMCTLHVIASLDEDAHGRPALDWDNATVYAGPQDVTELLDSRDLARIRELAAARCDLEVSEMAP